MTPEEIRQATFATLSSNWATLATPTPPAICFPNQPFTAPTTSPWIRPIIKMGETTVGEIGESGVGLRQGILMISIFDIAGKGTRRALEYAAILENIFRRKDVNGIIFNEPTTDHLGIDDNGFYHVMTSIDFDCWIGEQ